MTKKRLNKERKSENMNSILLRKLKEDYYEWCGLLSIEEIMRNQLLIRVVERLQQLLLKANA